MESSVHDTVSVNGEVMSQIASLPGDEEPPEQWTEENPYLLLGQRRFIATASNGAAAKESASQSANNVPEPGKAVSKTSDERVVERGYLRLTGSGKLRRVEFTEEGQAIVDELATDVDVDREKMREAAMNKDSGEAIGTYASNSVKTSSWAKPSRVVGSCLQAVEPWYLSATSEVIRLNNKLAAMSEEKVVRVGSLWDALRFKNFPAFCAIPFYMACLYVVLEAEIVCGMVYITAGFQDLVRIKFSTLAWVTPAKIAFSLVAGYVFGVFFLLKHLPHNLGSEASKDFHLGARRVMKWLVVLAPICFAWIVGVEKMKMAMSMSTMTTNYISPGMPVYIGVGIFMLAFSTFAITTALREAVESLYEHEMVDVPERVLAEEKLSEALDAESSCLSVIAQCESVIDVVQAAHEKFADECRFVHNTEVADLNARKAQIFTIPSRN